MVRVQFNGNKAMQQVNFKTISDNVVQLTGEKVPKSRKGFKVYRANGDFLGDYSEYTEIIAELENGFQFEKVNK